jgi:Bacterial archaeo-eukaryotic release factor family 3
MVAIALPTTAGAQLTTEDQQRLDRLIDRAAGYLRGYPTDTVARTVERLRRLAAKAATSPVSNGLQLTVGPDVDDIEAVPAVSADRVILEGTSLPRTQLSGRCDLRVLVITDDEVRLYEGAGGELYEIRDGAFPLSRGPADRTRHGTLPSIAPPRPFSDRRRSRSRHRGAGREALLARADAALHRYVSTRPTPIVVVGSTRNLRLFRYVTAHSGLIVAQITGNYGRTRAGQLAAVVNRRLAARRAI